LSLGITIKEYPMSKHQVIFINADFVFHIVRDDDNEPVYICYMREDGKFQEISTGHADSLNAVCASELKNLIRNVNDPAFDMLEVPVYMSPDSSITDLDRWYIRQMIAVYNHGQTFLPILRGCTGPAVPIFTSAVKQMKAGTTLFMTKITNIFFVL